MRSRGAEPRRPGFGSRLYNLTRVLRALPLAGAYPFSCLVPRRPTLWVFGNLRGYGDNPRYLLEHLRETRPDIRCVWLASSPRALEEASADGVEAYPVASLRGLLTALRARVGVICTRLADVNRAAVGGMFVVNTWHGSPLKRILLDSSLEWGVGRGPLPRLLGRLSRWLLARAHAQVDLVTAPSEAVKERFCSAFGLPPERIAVTGYARADVILGPPVDLRSALDLQDEDKVILYAPTWREPSSDADLWAGLDPARWQSELHALGATLLLKPHPQTPLGSLEELVAGTPRIRVIPGSVPGLQDVNRWLASVDLLVTDYSSIAFDYALLGRPILFFSPDHEDYSRARDFYDPYPEVTGGQWSRSWGQLLGEVSRCLSGDSASVLANVRALERRYNDFEDRANCARIVAEVLRRLSHPRPDGAT